MRITGKGFDEVKRYIESNAQKVVDDYMRILKRVGRETVTSIRDEDVSSWIDQTGNLRSSIGFIIVRDGATVFRGGFSKVDGPKRGTTTVDGTKVGVSFAESLAAKFPKGYALIIVAGMEYASYVEDIEGKVVLAEGRLFAKRRLDELERAYIARLGRK